MLDHNKLNIIINELNKNNLLNKFISLTFNRSPNTIFLIYAKNLNGLLTIYLYERIPQNKLNIYYFKNKFNIRFIKRKYLKDITINNIYLKYLLKPKEKNLLSFSQILISENSQDILKYLEYLPKEIRNIIFDIIIS